MRLITMEERLEKHREFLVDRIDPEFGLLDKLLSNMTLTRESVHKIKLRDNTAEDKNRILLDVILKNKKANELISALRDSGQIHLVNYLNADGGKQLILNSLNVTHTHLWRFCTESFYKQFSLCSIIIIIIFVFQISGCQTAP